MYIDQVVRTIDTLPDEVLLAIFDFYVVRYQDLDLNEVAYGSKGRYGRGNHWYRCVDGGEALFSHHHVA